MCIFRNCDFKYSKNIFGNLKSILKPLFPIKGRAVSFFPLLSLNSYFRFQRRITFALHNASSSNSKKETGTVRETAESPAGGRPLCEYCLSAVRV